MDKLDEETVTTLKAANIGEDLLHSLSRDDIKDLFPGPANFLRRRAIWLVVNAGKVETTAEILHPSPPRGSDLSNEEPNTSMFVTMSNPTYIVFTDSELELARRSYFEQKRLGNEHEHVAKKLQKRLSNVRSPRKSKVPPSKKPRRDQEMDADITTSDYDGDSSASTIILERSPAASPPARASTSSSASPPARASIPAPPVMDELQRIIQPKNSRYILEVKDRWETFYSKIQFYGVMKKAMKPPKTLNGVEHATAVFTALPLLFPSNTVPPRKLGTSREALFHILTLYYNFMGTISKLDI
ncbi:putative 1-phosphatidylinositol 3-phosphate 5-kinase [Dissostichus eleginoides]|uniref:1-phosphatidylinositol 3-phosphate 5-kinase n=1 Tax=Dissostichus eleginoides TaxID=100907 RepID=A0AAD9BFC9_DISEL|nr:putative 1-phosphatidylinositol 3-phosphate 5-kinase [Dissostichus eleginoides]